MSAGWHGAILPEQSARIQKLEDVSDGAAQGKVFGVKLYRSLHQGGELSEGIRVGIVERGHRVESTEPSLYYQDTKHDQVEQEDKDGEQGPRLLGGCWMLYTRTARPNGGWWLPPPLAANSPFTLSRLSSFFFLFLIFISFPRLLVFSFAEFLFPSLLRCDSAGIGTCVFGLFSLRLSSFPSFC